MEELSHDKCNKLWGYVLLGGSKEKAKDLSESLKKLPTTSRSNFFHLKKLFEQERAFVWYPEASLASLPRSELDDVEVTQVDLRNIFIGKGLLKLILSFLACSNLKMEAQKKRHESVQGLIHHTVHETIEPVIICYSLISTSESFDTKKVNRIIRRERKNSESFTQKIDWSSGSVSMIKCATYFSEPISVSALLQNVDHVLALSEEVL